MARHSLSPIHFPSRRKRSRPPLASLSSVSHPSYAKDAHRLDRSRSSFILPIPTFFHPDRSRSSFIFHLSSFIFHLSSFILHLSSFIFHLSSFILTVTVLFHTTHPDSPSSYRSRSISSRISLAVLLLPSWLHPGGAKRYISLARSPGARLMSR
jgi:hypothetical protein